MRSITIKDVAKICGVGVSTVSRALNNHPDINPETKQKIMQVIVDNNYIPNNSAINLKRSESNTIAVLIKGIDNPFFQGMFKVFESELNKQSYSFILHRVQQNQDEVSVALELVKEKKLKGIIFLGGEVSQNNAALNQLEIPYVLCTVTPVIDSPEIIQNCISIDDIAESFRLVDYLCSLGHKKIAIITADEANQGIGRRRYEGYKKALEKNGIQVNPRLVCRMCNDVEEFTPANGYEVTNKLLASGEEFSALFVISDATAFGACKAILESGKRIPEDYSVAGFDGIDMTHYYHPSLTTMKQPCEEMASASINKLMNLIEGKAGSSQSIFPAVLVIGESTRTI